MQEDQGKNFLDCALKKYRSDCSKMDFVNLWPKNMSLQELLWP